MRLIALPMLLSLLFMAACDKTGPSNDGHDSRATPTLGASFVSPSFIPEKAETIAPANPVPSQEPNIRIASNQAEAGIPTPKPQNLIPMASILDVARSQVPGEIIDVDLEDDAGQPEYEVEILTAEGRKIEIRLDARTGTVLRLEED